MFSSCPALRLRHPTTTVLHIFKIIKFLYRYQKSMIWKKRTFTFINCNCPENTKNASWSYCSYSAFISELIYFIFRVLWILLDPFQELLKKTLFCNKYKQCKLSWRIPLPNRMNFWKSAKGEGVILNPKIYVADFWNF